MLRPLWSAGAITLPKLKAFWRPLLAASSRIYSHVGQTHSMIYIIPDNYFSRVTMRCFSSGNNRDVEAFETREK
ncbi:hypothetical protein PoB_002884400 [Plakobranchus ocellatus]|uniref:Uncharacterized protein n=1 Tax=Plakobranchus ocellatus TaxID=259542 RepID=A0AAV4A7Y9_9GAST|nr:hypothetical protein PoB_002884400 [Plakobranchus ocellatus]